jgi:hypothetical protein
LVYCAATTDTPDTPDPPSAVGTSVPAHRPVEDDKGMGSRPLCPPLAVGEAVRVAPEKQRRMTCQQGHGDV